MYQCFVYTLKCTCKRKPKQFSKTLTWLFLVIFTKLMNLTPLEASQVFLFSTKIHLKPLGLKKRYSCILGYFSRSRHAPNRLVNFELILNGDL